MRGDRASLDAYLKRFRMTAGEFFAAPEALQRARLGLSSTDALVKPTADEAKAVAELKAKIKPADAPKPAV